MKKHILVGTIIFLALLSCGEERDDEDTQQNTISKKIIGTWTIVKKENNGTNVSPSIPCLNLGNFIFGSDQKLTENHNSTVNNNCVTDIDNYNYSIDENTKKITTKNAQNDMLVYTISSLSDKELILINIEGGDTTKYTFGK